MAKKRVPVPKAAVARLRVASANRCCVCRQEREAQVHHIDGDPSNGSVANLAFLCLICHSQASQRGGFGRHLDAHTVRAFRDEWHDLVLRSKDIDGLMTRLAQPDALKEAIAAFEVWRVGVEIGKLKIDDERIVEHLRRLGDFTNTFSGPAAVEVQKVLYHLVARTRAGMPAATAEVVANVALDASPLLRWIDPKKGVTESQALRFSTAVEIGFGLAYDGVLKLGDLRVLHAGARLLRFLLAAARRHPDQLAEANDGFDRALEAAERSGLSLGVEILKFERVEASEEGASLLDYSDALAEFVGLADIAKERRAEAAAQAAVRGRTGSEALIPPHPVSTEPPAEAASGS